MLIFLAVVCGYANAEEEQAEVDSASVDDDYEFKTLTREECYRKIFSERMYGIAQNISFSSENMFISMSFAANIPLSKEGPYMLDIELGFGGTIRYDAISEDTPKSPEENKKATKAYLPTSLLVQYVLNPHALELPNAAKRKGAHLIRSYYLEAGPTLGVITLLDTPKSGGFILGGGMRQSAIRQSDGAFTMVAGLRLMYWNSLYIGLNWSALF